MLLALTALLGFQLIGESLATLTGGMIPGPVIGFTLLAAVLAALPDLRRAVEPTANALLRHLALLFVPAAVGVVQQLPRLRAEGLAIGVALVVSTAAALAAGAICFRAVAKRIER
ncbi:MAG TPA: CidA/LrgA family protein [Acetobacteraceae bacterium]|jgi:putative effector of murein hydrolase LrgA (UPF0299 family)|nr:CidA/LrgA family protein [Acetobacteraceae bacterium]